MPIDKEKRRAQRRQYYLLNKEKWSGANRVTTKAWSQSQRGKDKARDWKRKRKAFTRQKLLEIKSKSKCAHCGNTDPDVLEFHHQDRKLKRFSVSHATCQLYSLSWATIAAEVAKCICVCANCHRKLTKKEKHWKKTDEGLVLKVDGPPPCEIIDMFKPKKSS